MEWSEDERSAAQEMGWDGRCKLWGRKNGCQRGRLCRSGDSSFRTPVTLPSRARCPDGVRAADRRVSRCPERMGRVWTVIARWADARRGSGLPGPGHPLDQPAWMLAAFGALDTEAQLIEMAQREEAERKARERAERGR